MPGVFSKWWAVQRLPSSKIPDGIFLQAGLAVLAFRAPPQTKTSLRLSNPAATPSSWCCYCPQQHKNTPICRGYFLNGGQYSVCLPVKSLTGFSCRPGSRFWPFGLPLKPKHRSAFQILPQHQAVGVATAHNGKKIPPFTGGIF